MAKKRAATDSKQTPIGEPIQAAAPIVRANVNRREMMAPTFVSIYANDVEVQTTPWDVRLILGEIFQAPSEADPSAVVRRLAELRMSPQLAKRVIAIVSQQLQVYEKNFGKLPQPPES